MNTNEIKNVLILGAGTMGLQIGLTCAAAGFEVIIYDVMDKVLDQGRTRIKKLADRLVSQGRMDSEKAESGLLRINFSKDPESSGRHADFISESVPEDPGLKQKVFSRFNEICPAHAIFTTNSSTLVPSMIAESTGRPDRFAALHFHDCSLTNVVDIMPHPGTSEETMTAISDFCRAIDQYPIVLKKEQHGYVFNTMLTELLAAALSLASKQVASPEDIDRAWMGIMKTSVGPFGIMDSVGLETVYKITDYWARKLDDPKRRANAQYLKDFVEKKNLGVKTGKGFYEYPNPAFLQPDFMKGIH